MNIFGHLVYGTFGRHYCCRNGLKFLSPRWLVTKRPCPASSVLRQKSVVNFLESHLRRFAKLVNNDSRFYTVDKINDFIELMWRRRWSASDNNFFLKCYTETTPSYNHFSPFFLYQIPWIFVINQVPCVSSCWGRRHTPVVRNESRESCTSHYTSRPVTNKNNQQTPQTSHYAVDRWNCFIAALT